MRIKENLKTIIKNSILYSSMFIIYAVIAAGSYWAFIDNAVPITAEIDLKRPPRNLNGSKQDFVFNYIINLKRKDCEVKIDRVIVSLKNPHIENSVSGQGSNIWDDDPNKDFREIHIYVSGGLPDGLYYYYNKYDFICNPIHRIHKPLHVRFPSIYFRVTDGMIDLNSTEFPQYP